MYLIKQCFHCWPDQLLRPHYSPHTHTIHTQTYTHMYIHIHTHAYTVVQKLFHRKYFIDNKVQGKIFS